MGVSVLAFRIFGEGAVIARAALVAAGAALLDVPFGNASPGSANQFSSFSQKGSLPPHWRRSAAPTVVPILSGAAVYSESRTLVSSPGLHCPGSFRQHGADHRFSNVALPKLFTASRSRLSPVCPSGPLRSVSVPESSLAPFLGPAGLLGPEVPPVAALVASSRAGKVGLDSDTVHPSLRFISGFALGLPDRDWARFLSR